MTDVLIKCLRNTLKQFRREYAKYSTIMNDEIILNMIFKFVSIDMVVGKPSQLIIPALILDLHFQQKLYR
jgi:uncharacterized membrane protein